MYSLYQAKEIAKKVINSIMNYILMEYQIDAVFMNSKNSKTSRPHRLILKFSNKTNLKRNDKYAVLSNLSIYPAWKNIKK